MFIDNMSGGRFVGQVSYKYNPLFPPNHNELMDFVFEKRPSLKGKDIHIELSEQQVFNK